MLQFLTEGFDYDRWANSKWLEVLPQMPDPDRAFAVFDHILQAQSRWITRCGWAWTANLQTRERQLDTAHEAWTLLLGAGELDRLITYKNLSGDEFTQPFHEIARHVINHGTYHRGHLRGLADAADSEGFPETDQIGFFRL
ncbi:MAG: DinB family protein [Fimbriimonas sp.]